MRSTGAAATAGFVASAFVTLVGLAGVGVVTYYGGRPGQYYEIFNDPDLSPEIDQLPLATQKEQQEKERRRKQEELEAKQQRQPQRQEEERIQKRQRQEEKRQAQQRQEEKKRQAQQQQTVSLKRQFFNVKSVIRAYYDNIDMDDGYDVFRTEALTLVRQLCVRDPPSEYYNSMYEYIKITKETEFDIGEFRNAVRDICEELHKFDLTFIKKMEYNAMAGTVAAISRIYKMLKTPSYTLNHLMGVRSNLLGVYLNGSNDPKYDDAYDDLYNYIAGATEYDLETFKEHAVEFIRQIKDTLKADQLKLLEKGGLEDFKDLV